MAKLVQKINQWTKTLQAVVIPTYFHDTGNKEKQQIKLQSASACVQG